jgi:hypothetical protein
MKRYLTLSNLRLALEVLLIILLAAVALSRNVNTQAASQASSDAPNALYWYTCNGPNNHIGLFTDRVHIYCDSTTPVAGAPALSASIHWFTVPTSPDSAAASRFMSLLQTSVITGKPVWVELDPNDTSGSSYGCAAGDCRRIYGMEMR